MFLVSSGGKAESKILEVGRGGEGRPGEPFLTFPKACEMLPLFLFFIVM